MKTECGTILHYEKKAGKLAERYESADVIELQRQLQSTLKNCESILELGCGSGRDAAFLLGRSYIKKMTITDGSEEMLAQAAKLHPELISHLKKLELPQELEKENDRFEGIYSIAALMHMTPPDIREILKQIARLLTPSGVLFISVCIKREAQSPDDTRVFTLKNSKWWSDQIEKTGLEITTSVETTDGLNRAETRWVNITAVKPE